MNIYPRSLYLRGWEDLSAEVVVRSADEEAAARAKGYKRLPEFAVVEPAPVVEPEPVKRGPGRPPKARAA